MLPRKLSILVEAAIHSRRLGSGHTRYLTAGVTLLCLFALCVWQSAPLSAQEDTPQNTPVVSPEIRYFHNDATGNLVAITDASGAVIWRADVRPFGLADDAPPDHPQWMMNQPLEGDIGLAGGLVHMGARVYDPLSGRFLSADPISIAVVKRENPQRFNRYSYALNNPYRFHDANGLQPVSFEETQARAALRNFIHFVEAKLGPNPSFADRLTAFTYGPVVPPDEIINTNNQPIRNSAGQEVDLDWGARLAGPSVANAMDTFLFSSDPKVLAANAKEHARSIYNPAKDFWNGVDWLGEKLGGKRQTGPRQPNDPNILGVDLLIDYIVFGGDLREYFDPAQIPPRAVTPATTGSP